MVWGDQFLIKRMGKVGRGGLQVIFEPSNPNSDHSSSAHDLDSFMALEISPTSGLVVG